MIMFLIYVYKKKEFKNSSSYIVYLYSGPFDLSDILRKGWIFLILSINVQII